MKAVKEHLEDLKKLDHLFDFDPSEVEQGTPEWFALRWGVFTASNAKHLFATKRGAKGVAYGTDYTISPPSTQGRKTYMSDLVSEIAAPRVPDEINAKPLLWGKEYEPVARDAYEALTFNNVVEVPFIYKDLNMRAGASPDGLIDDIKAGLELKSPWSSSVFIQFATADKIKHEERHQCQFNMWVSGRDMWHCAKFDPRMINCKKLHMIEVERCSTAMAMFDEAIGMFTDEMDIMLDRLGMRYGEQWSKTI